MYRKPRVRVPGDDIRPVHVHNADASVFVMMVLFLHKLKRNNLYNRTKQKKRQRRFRPHSARNTSSTASVCCHLEEHPKIQYDSKCRGAPARVLGNGSEASRHERRQYTRLLRDGYFFERRQPSVRQASSQSKLVMQATVRCNTKTSTCIVVRARKHPHLMASTHEWGSGNHYN